MGTGQDLEVKERLRKNVSSRKADPTTAGRQGAVVGARPSRLGTHTLAGAEKNWHCSICNFKQPLNAPPSWGQSLLME